MSAAVEVEVEVAVVAPDVMLEVKVFAAVPQIAVGGTGNAAVEDTLVAAANRNYTEEK